MTVRPKVGSSVNIHNFFFEFLAFYFLSLRRQDILNIWMQKFNNREIIFLWPSLQYLCTNNYTFQHPNMWMFSSEMLSSAVFNRQNNAFPTQSIHLTSSFQTAAFKVSNIYRISVWLIIVIEDQWNQHCFPKSQQYKIITFLFANSSPAENGHPLAWW